MSLYRWIRSALRSLFRKEEMDRELGAELDSVLGMMTEEKIRAGVPPAEALRQSRIELGGREQVKEEVRSRRAGAGVESVLRDVRFGFRTLLRRPSFTLTTVVVLGLGIGAPATVLTLVNDIFFQLPEHVSAPERVVRLSRSFGQGQGGGALGNPDYRFYRERNSTLSGLAAQGEQRAVAYSLGGDRYDQLDVLFVSENFFDVLGVVPALGRTFRPEENATPGTHPVVVLSHDFWLGAMGADPEVVGRSLILGGSPYQVIGVAPEGFGSVSPVTPAPDAWVPIAMYGALTRAPGMDWWQRVPDSKSRWLTGLGRLAPGVTFEAARDNLVALGRALDYEGKSEDEGAFLQRQFLYSPRLEATLTSLSVMLLLVVGIVFLVATFNAAVLLLARAATRQREIGIRSALGASRGRVVRQLLVETLLVTAMGGALGLLLAFSLSGLAGSLLPVRFAADFRPDGRVMLAAAGLSLITALAVGLLPALRTTSRDLREAFQSSSGGPSTPWLQRALVVGQVGLSLVLVAGALLFARSFWTARTLEVGFATEDRLVLQVPLTETGLEGEAGAVFLRRALDGIRSLPGVRQVAITRQIPFQGDWSTEIDAPPGVRPNMDGDKIFTGLNAVSPDYFQAAGIPVVRGRPFQPEDVEGAPPVLVLNEALAEALWPGESPLGRTLPLREGMDAEVVGVARNALYYQLGELPQPQTYVSLSQFPQRTVHFLIHTAVPPAELTPVVQETLREIEPELVFRWVTTMAAVVDDETARYEVSAVLVSVFSLVALLLAASGLYGTVSFLVAARTREIGVKMALGADRGRVGRDVLAFGLKLASAGVALGVVGTLAFRRVTESLLFAVEPGDPLPLAGACVLLLIVAAVAALAPARHATRVDPAEAIRSE